MEDSNEAEPPRDCPLCPRLRDFRDVWREREPTWHNAPVPTFTPPDGDETVRLLIVGLAPGLRGANRTGRPFTGDYAGVLLYDTLIRFGFARGVFEARPDDSLQLVGTAITNAVRCVPPENKPVGLEIRTSRGPSGPGTVMVVDSLAMPTSYRVRAVRVCSSEAFRAMRRNMATRPS